MSNWQLLPLPPQRSHIPCALPRRLFLQQRWSVISRAVSARQLLSVHRHDSANSLLPRKILSIQRLDGTIRLSHGQLLPQQWSVISRALSARQLLSVHRHDSADSLLPGIRLSVQQHERTDRLSCRQLLPQQRIVYICPVSDRQLLPRWHCAPNQLSRRLLSAHPRRRLDRRLPSVQLRAVLPRGFCPQRAVPCRHVLRGLQCHQAVELPCVSR
jgi:hypothetical protein